LLRNLDQCPVKPYAFGEHDLVLTREMPDTLRAAAMALAVGAGGAVLSYTTTVMLTPEEAMQAMTRQRSQSTSSLSRNSGTNQQARSATVGATAAHGGRLGPDSPFPDTPGLNAASLRREGGREGGE
jgi:hypothetical protein